MYLSYGELNEASKLCCDYIAALLGRGKELFGLEHSIGLNSPAACLPINAVDTLLHELKHHQVSNAMIEASVINYDLQASFGVFAQMNNLYEDVKTSVDIYLDTVKRCTQDQIDFNRSRRDAVRNNL